ncbi:MAG: T9SS type A sorting domain-containing protein [Bacteroidales bacterium]|nr:T9SS type A sorting domain-containing protein [Bacteroidales bacterium]
MKENAFRIRVSDDVPDQTKVVFNLTMTDGTHSYTDAFVIIANAPVFRVTNIGITDAEGNPTDRLYKGETSRLTFTVKNSGHSDSNEALHTIHFAAPIVTYEQQEIENDGIQVSDSLDVTFVLTINDDAPFGAILEYSLTTESDGYTEIYQSDMPLGNCIENFESDILNPDFQWSNSGSTPWVKSSEDPYEGNHCYTSTSNAPGRVSKLMLGVETEIPDVISFYYKDSGNDDDSFTFTINDTQFELSGDEWQLFETPIAAGKHVMKWTFSRKSSAEEGNASLDLIKLPPMRVEITSVEEDFIDDVNENMAIYPNPGDTELNILTKKATLVQVFDFQGRMIFEKENADGITTIDTTTWGSGIYLIKAGKSTKKWLKK